MVTLNINSHSVTRALFSIITLLSVLHIGHLCIYFWIDDPEKFDFIPLIDFDYEENIPTVFSSLLFFINAALLYLIWQHSTLYTQKDDHKDYHKNYHKDSAQWLGLVLVFFFLAFDESAKIHENIGDLMEAYIDAKGFLYFPWFIPYLIAFVVLVLLYLPFYWRLDKSTKVNFFISATLFVTGAAGFDILGAKEADLHGTSTILYSVLYTIEEILEMVGLVLFTNALLSIIRTRKIMIKFS